MQNDSISIGIAEDQALFRKGIVGLLNSFDNIQVIVEAENGQELLDKYNDLKAGDMPLPDITILDLSMPVLDGIKTTEILKKRAIETQIIIISSHDDEDIIVHLYEKGANAFLDKNAEPEEVETAIRSVKEKDFYLNEAAQNALKEASSSNSVSLTPLDALTDREVDVLKLICQEKTSAEIADLINLSKRTVENHRTHIMHKVQAKNTTGLVLFAIKTNIINVSELKISL